MKTTSEKGSEQADSSFTEAIYKRLNTFKRNNE